MTVNTFRTRCYALDGVREMSVVERSLVSQMIRSSSMVTRAPSLSGTWPRHAPRPSGTWPRWAYSRWAGPYLSHSRTVMPGIAMPRPRARSSAASMSSVATPSRRKGPATASWWARGMPRSLNPG
jgi:hypothetical protein